LLTSSSLNIAKGLIARLDLNRHWNWNISFALNDTLSVMVIRRVAAVVAVTASRARLGLLLLLVMWLDIDSDYLDRLLGRRRTRSWLLDYRRRRWLRRGLGLGLFDRWWRRRRRTWHLDNRWRWRRAKLWWRRWWQWRPVDNRRRRRRGRLSWWWRYNSGYAMANNGVVLLWMLDVKSLLLVWFGDHFGG
jgi:hypothetical protein